MAAPWNDGDPQSNPLTSSGGGFFGGVWDAVKGGIVPQSLPEARALAGRIAQGTKETVTETYLEQYPGYGDLWTYDAAQGVDVTPRGWLVLGAVGVALWMVLGGSGKRRGWR